MKMKILLKKMNIWWPKDTLIYSVTLVYQFMVCSVHLSWPCQPTWQTIRLMRFIYCDIFYCLSGSNYKELIILHNDLAFQSRHVFLTHWKNLTRRMTATVVDKNPVRDHTINASHWEWQNIIICCCYSLLSKHILSLSLSLVSLGVARSLGLSLSLSLSLISLSLSPLSLSLSLLSLSLSLLPPLSLSLSLSLSLATSTNVIYPFSFKNRFFFLLLSVLFYFLLLSGLNSSSMCMYQWWLL